MRHSFAPLIFAAAAFALPQASLDGLTACAQTAVLGALAGTGCGLTDVKCICAASGFQAAAQAAITTACGAGDAEATTAWATSYCAGAGSPLPSDSTISGDIADPTMISSTPTDTYAGQVTSTTDVPADATTAWVNGTCTKCAHSNDTAPLATPSMPQEPSPSNTGSSGPSYTGAASKFGGVAGMIGAVAAAAVFAL
ncbi:uncharacterized protein AB675_3045 [Cyphellophora attinorum]|uniref:CFEM domain-containing protein n=1 Tax=Cyphellophora attinorum TaxID=1664694 RepID=A0A0N1H5Y8_9EURO|nr:uncharacterized protein AB675_3045 [Phialophora attinorum]KPI37966.1 hypothetical protein AB675_3045 [Phialophora attinorum]